MEVIAIEFNEELLCLFVVCSFLFSALGESIAIWRYKRNWDKRKVEAFAEIANLIDSGITSGHICVDCPEFDAFLYKIYSIAISEVKREPWFALSRADKVLRPKRIKKGGK